MLYKRGLSRVPKWLPENGFSALLDCGNGILFTQKGNVLIPGVSLKADLNSDTEI